MGVFLNVCVFVCVCVVCMKRKSDFQVLCSALVVFRVVCLCLHMFFIEMCVCGSIEPILILGLVSARYFSQTLVVVLEKVQKHLKTCVSTDKANVSAQFNGKMRNIF